MNSEGKVGLIVTGVIAVVILFFCSMTVIPTGKIGVKTQFGAVKGQTLEAGLHFKMPFIQSIKKINCQVQKKELDVSAASKDMQTVTSKISVNYSVDMSKATKLYKEIGLKYEDVILAPAIQETMKSVTATFTAEQLITKRTEVSLKIEQELTDKVSSKGININDINIVDFDFSPEYNKAIEAKQVAQQNVLKSQQELEQAKIDAEKKITQAKAEADAMKLQKQELTSELLQKQAIEKWDGKLPTTNASTSLPFLNLK